MNTERDEMDPKALSTTITKAQLEALLANDALFCLSSGWKLISEMNTAELDEVLLMVTTESGEKDPAGELLGLLRELSYLEGDFVLSSGRASNYLIDVKRTAHHPRGAKLIGEVVWAAIREHYPSAVGVGGRTLGADPIAVATAIASASSDAPLHAIVVRRESKGHGTGNLVEASGGLPMGAPVVVLEDVTTTGASIVGAAWSIALAGFEVVGLLTLVDRKEGALEAVRSAGLEFHAVFDVDAVRGASTR